MNGAVRLRWLLVAAWVCAVVQAVVALGAPSLEARRGKDLQPVRVVNRHTAAMRLEQGRECFQRHDFHKAAEHLTAVRNAFVVGKVHDDALCAACLRMLTHTYYPHFARTHAEAALTTGREYHQLITSIKSSPAATDWVVCENAVHLAKIYLYLRQYAEGTRILQNLPLTDRVASAQPALELDVWLQRAKLAELAKDQRAASPCWEKVGQHIDRLAHGLAGDALAPEHARQYVPVVADLAAHRADVPLTLQVLEQLADYADCAETCYQALSRFGKLRALDQAADDAEDAFAKCVGYWEKEPSRSLSQLASALNNLAAVRAQRGRFREAQRDYERAIGFLQSPPVGAATLAGPQRAALLAAAYDGLGTVYLAQANFQRAEKSYKDAIQHWEAALALDVSQREQIEKRLFVTRCNRARVCRSQGASVISLGKQTLRLDEYYLELAKELPPGNAALPQLYNALADFYLSEGQWKDAQEWAEKAREALPTDCPLANRERRAAEHQFAIACFYQATAVNPPQMAQMEKAEQIWKRLVDYYQSEKDRLWVGRTKRWLAEIAYAKGRRWDADGKRSEANNAFADAQEYCLGAIAGLGDTGVWPVAQFMARFRLATVLHAQGESDEARQHLQVAIEIIEKAGATTTGAENGRDRFFGRFTDAYDLLIQLLLRQEKTEEALFCAEKFRNRTLGDELELSLKLAGIDLLSTVPENKRAALAREMEGLRQLRAQQRTGNETDNDSAVDDMDAQAINAQFHDLWNQIRDLSSVYRELLGDKALEANVTDFDKKIGEFTQQRNVILYYHLGEAVDSGRPASYLWVITDRDVLHYPLTVSPENAKILFAAPRPGPVNLTRLGAESLVQAYLDVLQDGGRADQLTRYGPPKKREPPPPRPWLPEDWKLQPHLCDGELALALTETLLPEAVRERIRSSDCDRVIVIPDGALHRLPFQALAIELGATSGGREKKVSRFLIDDNRFPPLSYAPSIRVLSQLDQRCRGPHQAKTRTKLLTVGGSLRGSLPECEKVAGLFPEEAVQPLLVGRRARKGLIEIYAPQARFFHFANHAEYYSDYDNLFGYLQLHASEKLELHNVYDLKLNGCELVVLSACETNVGSQRQLETGNSLARAFLVAGSARVVASFWKVSDEATPPLMTAFFDEVAQAVKADQPVDYAAALHAAMQEQRKDPKWSSPYYWAPFALIGPPHAVARAAASDRQVRKGQTPKSLAGLAFR